MRLAALATSMMLAGGCSLLVNLDDLRSAPSEGGPDVIGSDAPDAGADTGCDSSNAIFCDDFDHGALGAKWTKANREPSATLALADAGAGMIPSPPFALLAATAPTDGGSIVSTYASLELDLPIALHHVRSSYDVYFDSLSLNSCGIGGLYQVDGVTAGYGFTFLVKEAGMSLYFDGWNDLPDGGSTSLPLAIPMIPLQTWARIILEVDFDQKTLTLTLESPPGTPATPTFDHIAISPLATAKSAQLMAGIQGLRAITANPPCRVYTDDVLLESF